MSKGVTGIDTYTLLYIKQIIRTYYPVEGTVLSALEWPMWEKNLKKSGYTCVCKTDSLCCMAEINTTL